MQQKPISHEDDGPVHDHQVVIVGAGFAGLTAAQRLGKAGVDVVLIDQNNYHQFQPLLYQVATAQISASTVARPLRAIVRRLRKHVIVRTARVSAIDPGTHTVTTVDGISYRGRILVIAAGAEPNFFDTPGAREHAYPLYSVDNATALASAMLGVLDRASTAGDGGPGEKRFRVAVVGSGPTGVETAGAIAENIKYVIPRYFSPEFAYTSCAVHLIDMVDTVLAPFSLQSQHYALRQLRSFGVQLHLGSAVASVSENNVTLADGTTIDVDIVVWAGGLKGSTLISESGLATGRGGRVDVSSYLTAHDAPGVYVLGDAANIVDAKGRHLPQLGSVAQQSGKSAADNILAEFSGQSRHPFKYFDKGTMAMIGRGKAVAELGPNRRRVWAPLAFLAWLGVHVALLSGFSQRVSAVSSWCRAYLTRSRPQVVVYQPDVYKHERTGKAVSDLDPE